MDSTDVRLVKKQPLSYLTRPARSATASPPLLCFLHGYGEAAPLNIFAALTRHGPLRPDNPSPTIEPFAIVAPQLPWPGDLWLRYAHEVQEIVLDQSRQYSCDPQRLYLTGFSFGGNGVFDLAVAQPDVWAALCPVDPTRVPSQQIAAPIWLSLGEVSRRRAEGFIHRLALEPFGTAASGDRIWCDDEEDHVGTARAAYKDTRVYQWLLRQRHKKIR